ncbi:MAG TPA: RHS repeat-associated core domain-containing protein, partial [Phycisphaerae bacterium]|nr:RHS repeat-associated core domain-containing protein [Phycisphaerae bacterium]
NELISSSRSDDAALARGYAYDPIGNRTQHTEGSPTPVTTMYTRNDLNQYTHVYRYGDPQAALFPDYDEDGNLSALGVAGDMNCNGVVNTFDITPFTLALTDPAAYQQQYPDCDIMQADLNGDGLVNNFDIDYFMQAAGNVGVKYEWDAENRLTRVGPLRTPLSGDVEVRFAYDYLGRRVEKIVSEYRTTPMAGWYETSRRRYVWAGWLMLLELDGSNNIVRKYTWGLDLAGQAGGRGSAEPGAGLPEALEAAGGIGGLLAVYDLNDTPGAGQTGDDLQYVYTYDGNGNVVQVLDWAASSAVEAIKARYEYDPYGNVVAQGGDYAERNPFRFSTKYWDDETGLGYWGYRYYSSRMGRWISRDPIFRSESPNLNAALHNDPLSWIDPDGRQEHWGGPVSEPPLPLPPTSGPASQPAVDKSKACCVYREVSSSADSHGMGVHTNTCYKVHRCPPGATSPGQCCCPCSSRGVGSSYTRTVASADWGSCCFCTIRRMMNGPGGHQELEVSCPASEAGPAFHLTVDRFPRGNIISKGVVTISRWPSIFGTVVDEKTVACVDGQRYKAQLEAAYPKSATGGNERDWELDVYPFRQCWTFTWSWYRSAPPQISPCGF